MEDAMGLKCPWLGLMVGTFLLWASSGSAQTYNVTFLHTPPAKVLEGRDFVLTGNIIGADQVSIAALNFRRQGETEFHVRELRLVSGDRYEGKIPGDSVKPPGIEYFCYAVDFEGNRLIIFASEKEPQRDAVVSRESLDAEPVKKKPDVPRLPGPGLKWPPGRPWRSQALPRLYRWSPATTSAAWAPPRSPMCWINCRASR
jgi:hypothetical protein